MFKHVIFEGFCPYSCQFRGIECKGFDKCDGYKKGKCLLLGSRLLWSNAECKYGQYYNSDRKRAGKMASDLKPLEESCYIGDYVFLFQLDNIAVHNRTAFHLIKNHFAENTLLIKKNELTPEIIAEIANVSFENISEWQVESVKKSVKQLFADIRKNMPEIYLQILENYEKFRDLMKSGVVI